MGNRDDALGLVSCAGSVLACHVPTGRGAGLGVRLVLSLENLGFTLFWNYCTRCSNLRAPPYCSTCSLQYLPFKAQWYPYVPPDIIMISGATAL